MKLACILVSVATLLGLPDAAHAQNGCARLSWQQCDPWVQGQYFQFPWQYRIVESMYGVSAPNIGTDSQIRLRFQQFTLIPDAWRFDAGGCQGPGQMSVSKSALGCPAMGASPQLTSQFLIDVDDSILLHASVSYDEFTPSSTTRYSVVQFAFDHTFSSAGPTPPDQSTCGGADRSAQVSFDSADLILVSGQKVDLEPCDIQVCCYCGYLTWNDGVIQPDGPGGCPVAVATLPATWGRLKGMYR
jgi:hypothetical protein